MDDRRLYHPTTRALAVLELLQTHRRMSGPELARRLGVDGRTLRRYIALLEELGIPIATERGRCGAYMLVAGYKLPPMMFNEDEALALAVGLVAARGLGIAEAATAVEAAQAKLERVMPQRLTSRVRALAETVTLDLARSGAGAINKALLSLSSAAQARQRVRLRYRSALGNDTAREFDTYGLAYRAGCWYAVGWCHLRKDLRSFRLDRVQGLEPVTASFDRPADFDAMAQLTRGIATLPRSHAVELLLHTDLDAALSRLPGSMGLFEPVAGGVLLRGQADDLESYARELTRLPFDFTVRTPDGLREALRAQAARLYTLSWRRPTATAR
jgi:predicted DNA-binding transcriptional regulator YafY